VGDQQGLFKAVANDRNVSAETCRRICRNNVALVENRDLYVYTARTISVCLWQSVLSVSVSVLQKLLTRSQAVTGIAVLPHSRLCIG